MRNLLTSAIASLALATVFVGSASAATASGNAPQITNQALLDQLERDSTSHSLHQDALAEAAVSPSGQRAGTASTASMPNNAQASHAQQRAQVSGKDE
jgi:hypothetical protein